MATGKVSPTRGPNANTPPVTPPATKVAGKPSSGNYGALKGGSTTK